MMEIAIFGSSYGESIVLRIEGPGGQKCGVIDCYAPDLEGGENPVLKQLAAWGGTETLDFLIVTHPHEDHLRGAGQLLSSIKKVGFIGWWGGTSPTYATAYFEQLEQQYAEQFDVLGARSQSVKSFFDQLEKHLRLETVDKVRDSTDGLPHPFHTLEPEIPLKIVALSPWLPEQSQYVRRLVSTVEREGSIEEHRIAMNQTSLGLLIHYGEARIVLGGDVEQANWDHAFSRGALRDLNGAHFVKIPHHGSRSGAHPDMWQNRRFVTSSPQRTVAVATRYTLAGTALPDEDVLRDIAKAGCEVWVVAGNGESARPRPGARMSDAGVLPYAQVPFIARIDPSGAVQVVKDPAHRYVS